MTSLPSRFAFPAATRAWLAATLLLTLPVSSQAGQIPKGALVLRSGQANTDNSYKNEDTDLNGKLRNVSALCSPDPSSKANAPNLIATDTTRATTGLFAGTFGATQASTILNAGGTVVSKWINGNPNHCEISGLTLSQMKGVWFMCTGGPLVPC